MEVPRVTVVVRRVHREIDTQSALDDADFSSSISLTASVVFFLWDRLLSTSFFVRLASAVWWTWVGVFFFYTLVVPL